MCTGYLSGCQGSSIQRQNVIESLDGGDYRKKCIFEVQNRETLGAPGTGWGGWMGLTPVGEQGASLTAPKSCTNWYSLLDFWMGRMGVLQGDWQDLNVFVLVSWIDILFISFFKLNFSSLIFYYYYFFLLYNILLQCVSVSTVQQSDSVLHIHIFLF